MLKEGVLYRQWKDVPGGGLHKRLQLVLPASLVPGVLSGLHDTPVGGHLGVKKTLEKVQMRFYWPSQKKDVEKWCAVVLNVVLENLHFNPGHHSS